MKKTAGMTDTWPSGGFCLQDIRLCRLAWTIWGTLMMDLSPVLALDWDYILTRSLDRVTGACTIGITQRTKVFASAHSWMLIKFTAVRGIN